MLVTFVPKNPVASLGMVRNNKLSLSSRTVCIFILLTLIVLGGTDSAHTFFQWLFLLEIKVPEGSNFLTFPIHIGEPPYTLSGAPN